MTRIVIGSWIADPADGTLMSDTRSVRLEPKVMAVLLLLAERRSQVVSHEELLRAVWPDAHVAPGALARTVSILRRALGDDAKHPVYIETIPKRGYRLAVAMADETVERQAERPVAALAVVREPRASNRRLIVLAPAAVAVALAVVVVLNWNRTGRVVWPSPTIDQVVRLSHRGRANNENALAHYSRAVAANPQSADAHAGLATAFAVRADYLDDWQRWSAEAIRSATRAVALDPRSHRALKAMGTAQLKARKSEPAIGAYRQALQIGPRDPGLRNDLGITLMSSGRLSEALPHFEARILGDAFNAVGYSSLALGLLRADYPREARQVAGRALLVEPYHVPAQLLLARLDLAEGRAASARARLERTVEVEPVCAGCLTMLGLVDHVEGRVDAAERRYLKALDEAAEKTLVLLRLAQLYQQSGRDADGQAALGRAAAIAATTIDAGAVFPGVRWQHAAVAALRGDRAAAVDWYKRSVDAGRRDFWWDLWDPLLANIRDEVRQLRSEDVGGQFAADHLRSASVAGRIASIVDAVDRRLGPLLAVPGVADEDQPGWPSLRLR